MLHQLDISVLHATSKVKALLKKIQELNDKAKKFETVSRNIKLGIKNLKSSYQYLRYTVDSSCGLNCEFTPSEQKEISAPELYQEVLSLKPYSVHMIVFKKKPAVPETTPAVGTQPAGTTIPAQTNASETPKNTGSNADEKK